MKKILLAVSWLKNHWVLLGALSTFYIYLVAFISTLIFYGAFSLSISPYFDIADYFKILLREWEVFVVPFFGVIGIYMAVILRKAEAEYNENCNEESPKRFSLTYPFVVVILCLCSIFPLFAVSQQADKIKNGAFILCDLELRNGKIKGVSVIGGTKNVLAIYDKKKGYATIINMSEVLKVDYKGPSEQLVKLNAKRRQEHKKRL